MAWSFRIVIIAAGLLLLVPGTLTDIIGIAVVAAIFAIQALRSKKARAA